ncbi:hypothetical protein ECG_09087 [Echinococcus granulosus]|uniref:Expressed conserved protein n=1 Tax=Echinococcus granulosus TaxID=6210 RepID=A0A068WUH7_ECHGR|nr:hypothetical protein ECG_09087 [Echinococcus granulosus]CDS21318.1 expressed conserved protein [Echinococcus granulosus]
MWRRSATSASTVLSSVQLLPLLLLIQYPLGVLSLPSKITYTLPPPLSLFLSSESVALGDSVIIRCHINSNSETGALMAQSSMSLYCPAVPRDTFCFQNCRPQEVCNGKGSCRIIPSLEGVACRSIIHASGEIVYEYTLKHVTPEWVDWHHPGFACHSAAGKTNWTRLREKAKAPPEAEGNKVAPPPPPRTTTTSTTTTATTTTTTTPSPRRTTVNHGTTTNETQALIIASSNRGDDSAHWLNFLRTSSSGGFWTPEMIIITAFVALALSMLINCFCCVKWLVKRHHGDRRKLKGTATFGGQNDLRPTGVIPTVAWYPADPRVLPPVALAQQMTPSSAFHRSVTIPDESLVENSPHWNPFESADAARTHPEGKAANGSTMSNSAGRNSDSGFSIAHAGAPQPIQILSNPSAYPISFEPLGWSGPVTPRPRQHTHRLRHQFMPSYYVGVKRATSRETVFSERPISEIGFEPTPHHQHHYIPVVLGPGGGVRASQPQLASVSAYGAPLCSPADVSLIEKPGAGDGASAGGGSGSPKPGMTVLLPATVLSHQYGVIPPPSSSTERSTAPLLNADLVVKSQTVTPEAALEEVAVANETTGKSAAEVQMWLQSMPGADKDQQSRLPTKLADSLNTDYDVPSDWSEREPMLLREKLSSEETGPTE